MTLQLTVAGHLEYVHRRLRLQIVVSVIEFLLRLEWENDRVFRCDEKPQRNKKLTIFNLSCGNILISFLVAHKKTWEIRLGTYAGQGYRCGERRGVSRCCVHWLVPLVANIFRSISRKERWRGRWRSSMRKPGPVEKSHSGRHFVSAIKVCVWIVLPRRQKTESFKLPAA